MADSTSWCSSAARAAGEPTAGTAPQAIGWLALEQNGPWGAKAWTASRLDPALGSRIEQAAGAVGIRPVLIRRPGRHPEAPDTGRRLILAWSGPGPRLVEGTLDDPRRLAELDDAAWADVATGDVAALIPLLSEVRLDGPPILLVCTNGTRDVCCARLGRPVAEAAAAQHPGQVWETTHIAGHRFAPTTVLLPWGYQHGRVLDGSLILTEAEDGRLSLPGVRGRASFPVAGQAAELAVRESHHVTGLDDLTPTPGPGESWQVDHRDGRRWLVEIGEITDSERSRPESCGKTPGPVRFLQAGRPRPID